MSKLQQSEAAQVGNLFFPAEIPSSQQLAKLLQVIILLIFNPGYSLASP